MQIQIVTPAPRGSRLGNRVTALRWAAHLRALGHTPRLREQLDGEDCDLLIALHARKSAAAIAGSRQEARGRPVVLVLTGTDVYGDLRDDRDAQRSLELADRIVALQPAALEELPEAARAKAVVILQSARAPRAGAPDPEHFDVLVVAHLRAVKDPLLAARAARLLPADSRVRVRLVGQALDEELGREARRETAANPRFEWLGPRRFAATQELLASSRVLVVSSRDEGGPAVITEAIAAGLPVLSTRMPAALGLLGEDYPGLYPRGDERALARLVQRCEGDAEFLARLAARVRAHADEVRPELEREQLRRLLEALVTR